jgi:hypothetical protein
MGGWPRGPSAGIPKKTGTGLEIQLSKIDRGGGGRLWLPVALSRLVWLRFQTFGLVGFRLRGRMRFGWFGGKVAIVFGI